MNAQTSPRPALWPLIAVSLLSAGCSGDGPGSGGMTAGENERLEQAAETLDARAPSPAQPLAEQLESEVADGIAAEQAQPQGGN